MRVHEIYCNLYSEKQIQTGTNEDGKTQKSPSWHHQILPIYWLSKKIIIIRLIVDLGRKMPKPD